MAYKRVIMEKDNGLTKAKTYDEIKEKARKIDPKNYDIKEYFKK